MLNKKSTSPPELVCLTAVSQTRFLRETPIKKDPLKGGLAFAKNGRNSPDIIMLTGYFSSVSYDMLAVLMKQKAGKLDGCNHSLPSVH